MLFIFSSSEVHHEQQKSAKQAEQPEPAEQEKAEQRKLICDKIPPSAVQTPWEEFFIKKIAPFYKGAVNKIKSYSDEHAVSPARRSR